MARRRLNTSKKNLLIAAAVVGVTGVAGAGAYWKLRKKDPAKFVNAGDMYLKAGDLPDALSAYAFASGLRPLDPQLHLKVARVHDRMREQDQSGHVNAAIEEYSRAAELQPDLEEAWQGLLDANLTIAQNIAQNAARMQSDLYRLPEQVAKARNAAQHVLKLDPGDAKARAAIPILTINLWLSNMAVPLTAEEKALPLAQQPTDLQRVDRAVADLQKIIPDHPENVDLPYWVALAKIERAVRLQRQATTDDLTGASDLTPGTTGDGQGQGDRQAMIRALFAEASTAFDASIARQPRNAQLPFKKFEVLSRLLQADADPKAAASYRAQQRPTLELAQSLVSPADGVNYVGYRARWADYLAYGANDPAAAEDVFKQLLSRPTTGPAGGAGLRAIEDAQVRTQYGRLLARTPARQDEALRLLDAMPASPPASTPAAQQQALAGMLAEARLMRAQILIDQVAGSADPAYRAARAKAAQAEIDAVRDTTRFGERYEVLKAQGRLQLVTRQFRDAVQTLSAAADRLATSGGGTDLELLAWEAGAYVENHQQGQAIKLMEQAVKDPPGANLQQPHMALAQLYLDQQNYDDGRRQVAWLAERFPSDPRVVELQIQALGHDADPKAVAALYDRLPERTQAEQLEKSTWAVRTKNLPDAERLNELIYAARPGDPAVAIRLADLYRSDGNLPRANAVLQQAIDRHPERRDSLQLIRDSLNGMSQADAERRVAEQADSTKDPVKRASMLAELAASRHDLAAQIAALEQLRALAPTNGNAATTLFACYVAAHAYDKAEAMLPKLTEMDADQAHGQLFRCQLALSRNDAAGALAAGKQVVREFPQFGRSWAALGDAMRLAGQYEGAIQQYAASLERQGNNPQVAERMVDCQVRLGRLEDARRTLADARRKYPESDAYRKLLVQVEVAYGDPESVLPMVDEDLAKQPDQPNNWQAGVSAYAAGAQRRAARGDSAGSADLLGHTRKLLADALKRWPGNATFASELGDLQAHDGTPDGVSSAAETFRALAATPKWQSDPLPHTMLGRMFLGANRPEEAEASLRHALDLRPDAVDARIALSDALLMRRKPDDALAALAPAKDQPLVRQKYVDLLLALGRGAQAEADLQADVKAHPDDAIALNLLAHVYTDEGKFDAAEQLATQAIKASDQNVGAYFVRGTSEAARVPPNLDGAIRDLSAFRSAVPGSVPGRVALARALVRRRDLDSATRELEVAVEAGPDNKEARLLLARAYLSVNPPRPLDAERVIGQTLTQPALAHDPEVQRTAAAVYVRANEPDKAVASIRDALSHTDDQRSMLDEYLDVLLFAKRYDLLLDETAKFAGDAKTAWAAFDYRGRAKAASGDVPGAVAEFTTALDRAGTAPALGPPTTVAGHMLAAVGPERTIAVVEPRAANSAPWKAVLAACYNQAGDRARALDAAQGAMQRIGEFTPGDQLQLKRMTAQLCMGVVPPQADRAVSLFEEVLKQSPNDVDTLNNLACLLAEQVSPPRLPEALTYSQRACDALFQAGQDSPLVQDTRGWVLILSGRLDEGIDVLHQIIDAADFPDAHYHLGVGYLRKGMLNDARRELASADRLCKGADGARKPIDTTLAAKIDAAQKQVNEAPGAKSQAQADH